MARPRFVFNEDVLRELYVDREMSVRAVVDHLASVYGVTVSKWTVEDRLRAMGVMRNHRAAGQLRVERRRAG